MQRPVRALRPLLLFAIGAFAGLLASCTSNTTENTEYDPAVERYIGNWTAVRMNGLPFPYQTAATRPFTQVTALTLSVGQFQFTFIESAQQFDVGAAAGTAVGCQTSRRNRANTASLTGTDVISATLSCANPLSLSFAFTPVGDSLVSSYRGQRVVFVR
jgi:hypothetical protein